MSCFIKKQVSLNNSELHNISSDLAYNGIINNLIWNAQFTALVLFITIILWSRYKITFLGYVLNGLKRGEDVVRVAQHVETLDTDVLDEGEGIKGWKKLGASIANWFWLDRRYLTESCQESGYQYLCYQRYVATFQFILWIIGCFVILPINLYFGKMYPGTKFAATTMSNLVPSDQHNLYWIHTIFSVLIFPSTLICMKLFFVKIEKPDREKTAATQLNICRTLYLSELPANMRSEEEIRKYFKRKYPGSNLTHVYVNIKVQKIENLKEELSSLEDILALSQTKSNEKVFNKKWCCQCCIDKTDESDLAIEHYMKKKEAIERKLNLKVHKVLFKDKLDSAFVQVETLEKARQIGKKLSQFVTLFSNLETGFYQSGFGRPP